MVFQYNTYTCTSLRQEALEYVTLHHVHGKMILQSYLEEIERTCYGTL